MAAVTDAFSGQRRDQLLTQRFAVGIAEIDVRDLLQIIGKVSVLATTGVVDQLMRHAKMPSAHRRMNATHRVHRENRLGPGLFQRPEVGAVVHLMRRETVRVTMTGKEQHFLACVLADLHLGRGRAVRGVHRQ